MEETHYGLAKNEFTSACMRLLEASLFSERIKKLWEMERYGQSNCFGTALYIAGVSDVLRFACPEEFLHRIRKMRKGKTNGSIIMMRKNGEPWHAGIYMGRVGSYEMMFDQRGRGDKFAPQLYKPANKIIDRCVGGCEELEYYVPQTIVDSFLRETRAESSLRRTNC